MAKKNETPEVLGTVDGVEAQVTLPDEIDPWSIIEDVVVPRSRRGEEEYQYVAVNGHRTYVHLDGKIHKLPQPFAEVMRNLIDDLNRVDDYIDKIEPRKSRNGIEVDNGI